MSDTLLSDLSLSPRLTELLAKRGLTDPDAIQSFLNASLEELGDPFMMKGMKEAVDRIRKAVSQGEKILIHGDYDADGITSSAILARTMEILKCRYTNFLPQRDRDGYGVSADAIRLAAQEGISLMITADCGITAHSQISLARELGMDVIVIDHHRIPTEGLPPATVILNPLQEDCEYPFDELSAGGLAFKLSQALIGKRAQELLDLVALSTVADVAPLLGENRTLVKHGLKVLSERNQPGIRALATVSKLKAREMNTGHIGFILAPRINAAGRMSSPDTALRLLLTHSEREAESLANVLNEENKMRQREERQVVKEAIAEVERTVNFKRDRVIVVGRKGWHAGVVGIVASRLVDRFYRPAVVISIENGRGKGSGRSIKDFHLFHAMSACKNLFEEFGGHAQAAGLTIPEKNISEFRREINKYALANVPDDVFIKKVKIDLTLELSDLRFPFLRELALLEPHGAGNSRPVFFTSNLKLKGSPRRAGVQSLNFCVTDGLATFEASMNDQGGVISELDENTPFDLAYAIKFRKWDGIETVQLEVKQLTPKQ